MLSKAQRWSSIFSARRSGTISGTLEIGGRGGGAFSLPPEFLRRTQLTAGQPETSVDRLRLPPVLRENRVLALPDEVTDLEDSDIGKRFVWPGPADSATDHHKAGTEGHQRFARGDLARRKTGGLSSDRIRRFESGMVDLRAEFLRRSCRPGFDAS